MSTWRAQCPTCGDRYGGKAEHCAACHRTFSGTTAGDIHRTGHHEISTGPTRRRCLTDQEITEDPKLTPRTRNGTTVWGLPGDNPMRELARQTHNSLAHPPEGDPPDPGVQTLTEPRTA